MRGFVINAVLVLWRRILSRCAPVAEFARLLSERSTAAGGRVLPAV